MARTKRLDTFGNSSRRKSWGAVSLLVAVAVIPSVCVSWLVYVASESKQLAMQQLFNDARSGYLETGKSFVAERILEMRQFLDTALADLSADEREAAVSEQFDPDGFLLPASEEHALGGVPLWVASAMNSIRLAIREGRPADAKAQVAAALGDSRIGEARLADGRSAIPILYHLAIDLSEDDSSAERAWLSLRALMLSERASGMPLKQRRYYLKKLSERFGDEEVNTKFRRVEAATEWLSGQPQPFDFEALPPVGQSGAFTSVRSSSGEAVLLFRHERFRELIDAALGELPSRAGGRLSVRRSEGNRSLGTALPLHARLQNLDIVFTSDPNATNWSDASREVRFLGIVGALVVALSLTLSFVLYRVMRRQSELARLKSDLVATVSHELKTPVASIRLLVDVLQKSQAKDPVRVTEYLELISNENRRLGSLIENFLSFSRMERGAGNFVFQETSAEAIAGDALKTFRESAANNNYPVRLRIGVGTRSINADSDALRTALVNLLENARKYGGTEPDIELSVADAEDGVVFSVSDKGEGIPKDEQSKIFERFYQSNNRLSKHAGGVGLGLSIVSFIAEKHCGSVSLESAPGKGSVFKIKIPYA